MFNSWGPNSGEKELTLVGVIWPQQVSCGNHRQTERSTHSREINIIKNLSSKFCDHKLIWLILKLCSSPFNYVRTWIIYTDDDIDWRGTRAVVFQLLFPHYIGSFSLLFQVINFLKRACFKYPAQCFQLWQRAGFPFQSPHFMPAADGRWLAQVGIWDSLWVSPEKSLLKVIRRMPVNFAPTLKANWMWHRGLTWGG